MLVFSLPPYILDTSVLTSTGVWHCTVTPTPISPDSLRDSDRRGVALVMELVLVGERLGDLFLLLRSELLDLDPRLDPR